MVHRRGVYPLLPLYDDDGGPSLPYVVDGHQDGAGFVPFLPFLMESRMTKFYREFITAVDHSARTDGGYGYWCLTLCTLVILGTCVQSVVMELGMR